MVMLDAFKTCGSSPPKNYTVRAVSFRLVREGSAPRAQLGDPTAVATIAGQLIPDDGREHFGILLLNKQNRLIAYHEISVGTLTASLVSPREVFGAALRTLGCAAVILLHNHPSGDPKPSREDIRLTRQLVDAGKLLDITVHDHIIIGSGRSAYESLAARGELG
jgi:DNA repair protein RadC